MVAPSRLVKLAVRAVRGRIAAIPWIMFFIAALLTFWLLQLGGKLITWRRFFRVTEILLLLLAAFVEAYWSSMTAPSPLIKYLVGAALWMLMAAYLLFAGRSRHAPE